jgi:16S rRNA (adenine1518-N6/adenine1519-N6)-dimethyltransferase
MSEGILTPTETRETLASLEIRPNRKLGQNFLIDGNIVRKSLEYADVAGGDTVIEIGPGLGTLTRALLSRGARVYAIEIDRFLHKHLKDQISPKYSDRFFPIYGDAVKLPLAGYEPDQSAKESSTPVLPEKVKIVSNLPYSIATPWLDAVLRGPLPSRICIMVQKEAADRYLARPGGKMFGAITIFLQSAYSAEATHAVSRSCFTPKPAVDSVLLKLARRASPRRFSVKCRSTIRGVFAHRRKQIGSIAHGQTELRPWLEILERAGFDPKTRPEAIPVELWAELDA